MMPGFHGPTLPPTDYSAWVWRAGNWRGWTLDAMLADKAARIYLRTIFHQPADYHRSVPAAVREWITTRLEG